MGLNFKFLVWMQNRSWILELETGNSNCIYEQESSLECLFIVGTMLFFLFGIFGVPKSLSGEGLLTALTDHIHLGLDLKGGTH